MPGAAGAVALIIRHVSKLIYTHLIVNTNKKTISIILPAMLFLGPSKIKKQSVIFEGVLPKIHFLRPLALCFK